MSLRRWFPTLIYQTPLTPRPHRLLQKDLQSEIEQLQDVDQEGQRWSLKNYPGGYTSYATRNDLHFWAPAFKKLQKQIDRHVQKYARSLEFDLDGGVLRMSTCWVNIMPPQTTHSWHIHPLSVISGTYYLQVPARSAPLKFEDPRLDRMMAAPARQPRCRPENQRHIAYTPRTGHLILFESWLRHEVPAQPKGTRISISFNYDWVVSK